jgi:signal transduction histidine kinase
VHVLFAHGLESGPWGRKSLALRDAGHDVTAPDARGLDLDARVGLLVEALRAADPVPVVVGSSFGGIAALLAVRWLEEDGLRLPGLVLCAPALGVPAPARWQIAMPPRCPTVLLHGRDDRVVPIELSRDFAAEHGVELVEVDDDHSLARSIDTLLAIVDRLAAAAPRTPSGLGQAFEALVGIIAHDLRNPLGTVQLTAELLRSGTGDARAKRQGSKIVESVARMVAVLEQAQHYAALLAQPRPARCHGPRDVVDAVAHIVQTLRPEERSAIEVTTAGDTVGPWDPELLTRLLGELVDNALGYRDVDPVCVRIDGSAPERVVVEIENGGAITPAQHAASFVPYSLRKAPRTHGARRLGLGLVLVRRWAELLEAEFSLRADGGRTLARLVLPRAG